MKRDEERCLRLESQAHLKVALLQVVSEGAAIEANARKGEEFCRRAADRGADIALFPEMWSVGYPKYPWGDERARADWLKLAVPRDGPFVDRFQRLARELRIAIAITDFETGPILPRDALTLVDWDGAQARLSVPSIRCTSAAKYRDRLDTSRASRARSRTRKAPRRRSTSCHGRRGRRELSPRAVCPRPG